jgi:hypothetical protein
MSHPSKSPEEAIGEWDPEIEVDDAQDVHLHVEQLTQRVRPVADIQKVVH